jgi:hypothetical protein
MAGVVSSLGCTRTTNHFVRVHAFPSILTALLTIFQGGFHAAPAARAALPDLTIYTPAADPAVIYRTFDASDCTVNEGCIPAGTRRLLIFVTQTRNVGTADLIMGNPATNSLFVWDPCHGHYHFGAFADYRLRDTSGNLAAQGHKIGFCLEDVLPWDPNVNQTRVYDCSYQGIQKGWADVYEDVPCQWIDITGVPAGNYVLEIEVNPDHVIAESDYGNNLAQIPVVIPAECSEFAANDNFDNATVIASSPASLKTFNVCASKEAGEPAHAGNAGGYSIWFQFTPPTNGPVRLTTRGSDFDTLLAVYTGTQVGSLSLVASNDDIDPGNILQSALSFNAAAGRTYNIAVDGYDGAVGMVVLSVNPPLNDAFGNCQTLTGTSGRVTGYTIGALKEPGEPDHNSDFGGHSVWYCWTAPASGTTAFDTIGSNFDTLLAVYTGSAVNALTWVASDNDSGGNLTSRVIFNATGGQTYHIAVDGAGGATGNLVLNWYRPSHLSIQRLEDRSIVLTLTGANASYDLQGASDLHSWSTLTNFSLSGGSAQYKDTSAASAARRFYRAIQH